MRSSNLQIWAKSKFCFCMLLHSRTSLGIDDSQPQWREWSSETTQIPKWSMAGALRAVSKCHRLQILLDSYANFLTSWTGPRIPTLDMWNCWNKLDEPVVKTCIWLQMVDLKYVFWKIFRFNSSILPHGHLDPFSRSSSYFKYREDEALFESGVDQTWQFSWGPYDETHQYNIFFELDNTKLLALLLWPWGAGPITTKQDKNGANIWSEGQQKW